MTSASAPGKVILFGEHAVVYGQPALAVPVSQVSATVTVWDDPERTESPSVWSDAIHLQADSINRSGLLSDFENPSHPDAINFTIRSVLDNLHLDCPPPLKIHIDSTIPVASGLGSGAAVSVALVRALSAHLGQTFNDNQVNQIAFETEKIHHGTPSGIDNTVITYAKPVWFIKSAPIETLTIAGQFTLLIADSGIPAETRAVVGDVRRLWQSDPQRMEGYFSAIGETARLARIALQAGNPPALGQLMTRNHHLLQEISVSSPELDLLVQSALQAGALGAKLSGGGRGGNMLALTSPENASHISAALTRSGAKSVILTTLP